MIILGLLSIGFGIATTYLDNTYHFLSKTQVTYDTLNYSVVVLKSNNYNDIKDLKNSNIAYIYDDYKVDIRKELNNNGRNRWYEWK